MPTSSPHEGERSDVGSLQAVRGRPWSSNINSGLNLGDDTYAPLNWGFRCPFQRTTYTVAAEQIIYWGGGATLHEVVEHDSLISLRGKGGLYWVMMESIT